MLKTLEFPKVVAKLQPYLMTELGQDAVKQLAPSSHFATVQMRLEETEEGMTVVRLQGGMPLPKIVNIYPHLKRLAIGASLNGIEIAQIGRVLRTSSEIQRFFDQLIENHEIDLPQLSGISARLQPIPTLSGEIRRCIEEDGSVRDEASTMLRQLRHQMKQTEQQIRDTLNQLIHGKQAKYLSNAIITMRGDRYVIPVKQEYRHVFGGVVHDESASGQTLFVEPKNVVELNNRLRQAQSAEKQEELRILAELSESIAPYHDELVQSLEALAELDVINAKALLAKEMKATIPMVNDELVVHLRQARHPLLDPAKVVPNDLEIGDQFKTLVVTGPNTGGKTITLKTLGLLQLMGQAGFALPVAEESEIGVFDQIMADIGDEQSIEQNLSTFSGHMRTITHILAEATDQSLVLFDELGAGTDPQEGAALAIAILDALAAKGAHIVATTHYPELKLYGYNRPETTNASMEFDVDSLEPTYRLLIGIPGRSNAFEIAHRLGLDESVIDSAKQLMDQDSQALNNMVTDLETRRQQMEQDAKDTEAMLKESEALQKELKEAYQALHDERDALLKEAKKKANHLVEEAEVKAEEVIEALKEKQRHLDQEQVKEHELIDARTQLRALHHEEEAKLKKNKVLQKAKAQKALHPGDEVNVLTYGQRGTLIRKRGDEWEVQLGVLKMSLPESELELIASVNTPQPEMTQVSRTRSQGVKTDCDVRGMRYEEAMHEVENYLDQALLAGYPSVTIIHGKGTGALRQGIQKLLNQHRHVAKFEYAPASAGGNGATVVYFK